MNTNESLFKFDHGIIPACDVEDIHQLRELVEQICRLEFIVGYKVGMQLVIAYGIEKVVEIIRYRCDAPIIYDHQKFGTDIPGICGGKVLKTLKNNGVDALIIFPHAGKEVLKASIDGCRSYGIVPIVGGEMTHKGYLATDGGYLENNAPERIYVDGATLGASHFVFPGTKLEIIDLYVDKIKEIVAEPRFLFPGIGSGQGGDIVSAFESVRPYCSYAIVGRGIYGQPDKNLAAQTLWNNVLASFPGAK